MFHTIPASSATSEISSLTERPELYLVRASDHAARVARATHNADLVQILSRRCSSFCAEAAVLVLVFGLLDYFMMKGHIELSWIAGALLISVLLLALSIVIELSAHRWMKAHP